MGRGRGPLCGWRAGCQNRARGGGEPGGGGGQAHWSRACLPGILSLMGIIFGGVSCPPIEGLDATAPDGAVIGIIGEDGAGKSPLLRLAAGLQKPISGVVEAGERRRLLG